MEVSNEKLVAAYQYVFNSPEGQIVLQDLGVLCREISDPSLGQDTTILPMNLAHEECAYINGQRSVYRQIVGLSSK